MSSSPTITRASSPTAPADAPARRDLLAVGELFLDVLYGPLERAPRLGEELHTDRAALVPGGIANFARAAAALGARTAVAAPVGDGDAATALVRAQLQAEGIAVDALQVRPGWALPITSAIAYDGDRALITGGADRTGAHRITPDTRGADAVAVHLHLEDMPWLAGTEGRVFADVGWDPTGRWDRAILRHLEHCFAMLPNAEEAQAYTRTDTPEQAVRALAELVPVAVVTLGARGALGIDARTGAQVHVEALDLGPADATGAGDTLGAALIVGFSLGWELPAALELATLAATARAAGVAGPGRIPALPQLAELARAHDLPLVDRLDEVLRKDPRSETTPATSDTCTSDRSTPAPAHHLSGDLS